MLLSSLESQQQFSSLAEDTFLLSMTSIIKIKGDDGTSLGNYKVPPEGKPVPEVLDSIFKKHGLDGVLVEDDSTHLTKSDLVTAGHTYTFWPSINVPPLGVKSGDLLSAGHGLSQFVACLRDQGLQEIINSTKAGSLTKLPEEVMWMEDESTFTNELYVRPCYQELLEAKERYFELNKKLSSVVFIGTPGIGKSHFCALVIAKKLIAGMTVYFESSRLDTKEFFKLELEGGVRTLESLRVLDLLQDTATTIYIVDGGPPSRPNSPLETQVFASPSHSLYRAKKKAWPWLYLYTPLFDLEEMCKCKSVVYAFNAISDASVEEWFRVAGGVARTVLKLASEGKSLQDWKAEVMNSTKSLDVNRVEEIVAGLQADTFSPGSNLLFHWRVVENCLKTNSLSPEKQALRRFKRKIVCFASDWVANLIYHKLRLDNVLKVVSFILSTTGEVETAALRGYWWEAVCHMIISSGGIFACRWLNTGEEFRLKLPMAQSTSYKSYEEVAGNVKTTSPSIVYRCHGCRQHLMP